MDSEFDVIVVGGGPAGMQAALTTSYLKLKVCVIELENAGGALVNKYPWKHIDEFLGYKNMTGADAAKKIVEHVRSEGVTIKEHEEVREIIETDDGLTVKSSNGVYHCKAVVLTIGLGVPRKLGVPGEDLEGVVYSMSEPLVFKGKKVLVVGGGDTAVEQACSLSKIGAEVKIAHRKDQFRASEKNICELGECKVTYLFNTEVKEIIGADKVEKVVLTNNQTGGESEEEFDNILLLLGTTSNKDFLEKLDIEVDKKGSVVVTETMQTSRKGVFAAGDVVGRWLRIPYAIGEGGLAGLNAFKFIKNPYWGSD